MQLVPKINNKIECSNINCLIEFDTRSNLKAKEFRKRITCLTLAQADVVSCLRVQPVPYTMFDRNE